MTILDKVITIKSVMTEANKAEIKELIDTMNQYEMSVLNEDLYSH